DSWKSVVEQDHGSGLSRYIGASQSHRDSDVGLTQCWSIIDTVARHRDDFASSLIGAHQGELFRRAHTGEDPHFEKIAIIVVDEALHFFSFDDCEVLAEPRGPGDAACGHSMIPRSHDHSNASLVTRRNGYRHV